MTYEVEAGRALSRETYLTANLFSLRVKEPIAYGSTPAGVGTYLNFDHTGAEGLDIQLKTQAERLSLDASVSYARARDHRADFYRVDAADTAHVGFAALKVAGQARWRFAPGWSLNPGLLLYGPRYGYRFGQTATSRFGGTTLLDVGCTWAPSERLQAGLFLTNATNRSVPWIQAYGLPGTGGNPPLPGPGREVSLRLTFNP